MRKIVIITVKISDAERFFGSGCRDFHKARSVGRSAAVRSFPKTGGSVTLYKE